MEIPTTTTHSQHCLRMYRFKNYQHMVPLVTPWKVNQYRKVTQVVTKMSLKGYNYW